MEGQAFLPEEIQWQFIRERFQLGSHNLHNCCIKTLVEHCRGQKIQIMQPPFNRWKTFNRRSCSNMKPMPTTSNHNTFFNAHTYTLVLSRMFNLIINWCRVSLIVELFLTSKNASNKLQTQTISRRILLLYLQQEGHPEEPLVAAGTRVELQAKALLIHTCWCSILTAEVQPASPLPSQTLQGLR